VQAGLARAEAVLAARGLAPSDLLSTPPK
jgi:hypothetical protein